MQKYYILIKSNNELLEIFSCKNVIEAKKYAAQKYLDLVLECNLVVVGKNGYNNYYRK